MTESMRPLRAAAQLVVAAGELTPDLAARLATGFTEPEHNELRLDEFVDTESGAWSVRCVGLGVLLARRVLTGGIEVVITVERDRRAATFRYHRTGRWLPADWQSAGRPILVLRQGDPAGHPAGTGPAG